MTTVDAPMDAGFGREPDRGNASHGPPTTPLAGTPGGSGFADRLSSLRTMLAVSHVRLFLAVARTAIWLSKV